MTNEKWRQKIINELFLPNEQFESYVKKALNLAEEHFNKMYNDNGYVYWLEKEISRLKNKEGEICFTLKHH